MGMVSPHFAGPIKAGGVQTGDGNVGDLGFGRYIGLLTAFFGQWLAPGLAKSLGIGLAFLTIMIGGMWTGALLARLVEQDLLLNVCVAALYLITFAGLYRLIRARG